MSATDVEQEYDTEEIRRGLETDGIIAHGRGGPGVVAEVSDPCAVRCAVTTDGFYVREVTPTRSFRAACWCCRR